MDEDECGEYGLVCGLCDPSRMVPCFPARGQGRAAPSVSVHSILVSGVYTVYSVGVVPHGQGGRIVRKTVRRKMHDKST